LLVPTALLLHAQFTSPAGGQASWDKLWLEVFAADPAGEA